MKFNLSLLGLLLSCLSATTLAQQAKLEGQVVDDKDKPASGVRVVAPGGQAAVTDSTGHFIISFPASVQPGQATRIAVAKTNWAIYQPMFGNCVTQDTSRNYELLHVVIVPKGSPLALSPRRLSEVIAQWAAERAKLSVEVGSLKRTNDEYTFLRQYSREYGFTLEQFRQAAEQWAKVRVSDDKETLALKEYWQRHYASAAQLARESARAADEELEQANQRTMSAGLKVIRRYKLEGNALYAQYQFREALDAYSEIRKRFESKELPKDVFPEAWAETLSLIGNAKESLGTRVEGEEGSRLLKEALAEYRASAGIYTREQSPQQWVTTQNNLGSVLRRLAERSSGPDRVKLLGDAIALYRTVLDADYRQFPEEWAKTQNNLGDALWSLGEHSSGDESAKSLLAAVAAYGAALEIRGRRSTPDDWATTQTGLGNALQGLGERVNGAESVKYLNDSVAAYRSSLEVRSRTEASQDWALTEINLGNALQNLGKRTGGADSVRYLDEAVSSYRAALEVFTRGESPQDWATVQHNLGAALQETGTRVGGTRSINYLNESVAAYRAALQVRTKEHLPQDWARTQANLGGALLSLSERLGGPELLTDLADAVSAFDAALEIFTREQFPQDWARTLTNAGSAAWSLGERIHSPEHRTQSIKFLNDAVTFHRAALTVLTRDQLPQQWAATQSNLGNALWSLSKRYDGPQRLQYLTAAITAYKSALQVRTRDQLPQDWALTQTNLANVLEDVALLSDSAEGIKYLREAIGADRATLQVFTREEFPQQWATTQNNLGTMLWSLGRRLDGEDGVASLKESVTAYRSALEILTPENSAQTWLNTQSNLARACFHLGRWADSAEAFKSVTTLSGDKEPYDIAAWLYHDKLFKFDQAFLLKQKWLVLHPDDLTAQAEFAEEHFTTGRFDECEARINALLTKPEITASSKVSLRAIEIASLLADGKAVVVPSKLEALISLIRGEPADFKIAWSFAGTKHFIGQTKVLILDRAWITQLFNALEGKDRETILKALEQVQSELKAH